MKVLAVLGLMTVWLGGALAQDQFPEIPIFPNNQKNSWFYDGRQEMKRNGLWSSRFDSPSTTEEDVHTAMFQAGWNIRHLRLHIEANSIRTGQGAIQFGKAIAFLERCKKTFRWNFGGFGSGEFMGSDMPWLLEELGRQKLAHSFRDVPADHWAAKAVAELKFLGLLKGYPDGSFTGQGRRSESP